jgi:hypothetical protein
MSSQVISYRLNTEEVLALRRKALPGESDNQTAQRLMRESLGMSTKSTVSLDERIESVVEDRFSSFVVNQNELLSRLQERLQQLETQVAELSLSGDYPPSPSAVDKPVGNVETRLTQAELAKRLEVDPGTLTKNRSKPNFPGWSGDKDPENISWSYLSELKRYTPLSSTTMSTKSTSDGSDLSS